MGTAMADNKVFDGIEIPDDLLDSIAGGVLTDTSKEFLRVLITSAKKGGYTMDDFVQDLVSFAPISDSDAQEVWDYIYPIWDQL